MGSTVSKVPFWLNSSQREHLIKLGGTFLASHLFGCWELESNLLWYFSFFFSRLSVFTTFYCSLFSYKIRPLYGNRFICLKAGIQASHWRNSAALLLEPMWKLCKYLWAESYILNARALKCT